jgi:hypothetical protein
MRALGSARIAGALFLFLRLALLFVRHTGESLPPASTVLPPSIQERKKPPEGGL